MVDKKSFTNYVFENKKEYKYTLKFAIHNITDSMIDYLEACLKKYSLKVASPFRNTPIQENPLDFPNVKNTSVFSCDITLEYPASLDFLKTYLCNSLGIPASILAVYSENDPRQIETDLYNERSSKNFKDNYKPVLGTEYNDPENSNLYGEKYNMGFLKELEKVRKEREEKAGRVNYGVSNIDHSTLPSGYDLFDRQGDSDKLGFFGRVKNPNLNKTGVL